MTKKDTFNIIIAGTGGQGLITLTQIIAQAALIEGYDVKTSELHGLSQRGGSVQTHIRFGKRIFSPLVALGKADLILGLEISEALRNSVFANPKTIILTNKFYLSYQNAFAQEQVVKKLKSLFNKNLYLVPASEICQKKLAKEVVSGTFLLGYAAFRKLIPLKPPSVLKAISKVIPKKYLDLNIKAFKLAKK